MAVNFRLAYNDSTKIVDLFPRIGIAAVENNSDLLHYSVIDNITIPVPSIGEELTQTITITTTTKQISAPVAMFLVSTGTQAEADYATISQYSVEQNQLIITRLYNLPTNTITVQLVFLEAGV